MDAPCLTGLKVLVVDDDNLLRECLKMQLTHLGHVVTTAPSGAVVMDLLAKAKYDLVITDYYMPDLRGDELARILKLRYPGLPILMISAYADMLAPGCLDGLANYLLRKPFFIPQL